MVHSPNGKGVYPHSVGPGCCVSGPGAQAFKAVSQREPSALKAASLCAPSPAPLLLCHDGNEGRTEGGENLEERKAEIPPIPLKPNRFGLL